MDEKYAKEFERLIRRLKGYSPVADEDLLWRAAEFAWEAHKDQLRKSGQPYFEHPLEVAKILADLRLDYITIAGGLLHDVVEDTGITFEEVKEQFGEEIASLVDGVTKIGALRFESHETQQAENFRKMILSMVRDIRVILIKFADRLHNMRTLEFLPERKQKRIAVETRDVYAPLAHRLGIAKMKWELEDLALKALEPDAYWDLVKKIADKREERERYLRRVTAPIRRNLKAAGIDFRIEGRPKHFYSIYQKMQRRGQSFEEIYDLLAVRIIVQKIGDCYHALGIVHSLFTPVHERFKDYIATPKSNLYQSLHTTVVGPGGKMVEIQIRTEEMHRIAEEGIAAHWRYKEGQDKKKEDELDKKWPWLRQTLEWLREASDPREFMENLRIELFQDEVFVFTPKGDLIKLPAGSTPVDFAYAVHTDIGHHCLGAKVNGRIVPLNYELKSGDLVEIITSEKQRPNPDWLQFVKTSKARTRIKRWIKESLFEQSVKLGEEILTKQFKKYDIKGDDEELLEIAQSFGHANLTQFYAAIGRGDIAIQTIIRKVAPEKIVPLEEHSLLKKFIGKVRGRSGVKVQGLDNLMISFGKCCQPVPGDKILGFITRGRGVVVHRSDCRSIVQLLEDPERNIEVEWDVDRDKQFMVRLRILGEDRRGFLRDVSESITSTDTNIASIEMKAEDSFVHSNIIIEVKNLQHLTRVIKKLSQVKGVVSVERLDGASKEVSATVGGSE